MDRAALIPAREAAMRLRPHRRTLVVWHSSAMAAGRCRGPTRTRPGWWRRIRRGLTIGALLAVLGALRSARVMRSRWEPLALLGGVLLTVGGYFLPGIGLFFPGFLVITVTLLKGNSDRWRGARPGRSDGAREGASPMIASYMAAMHGRATYRSPRCSEGHIPR
jgi:hypothetical protein